MKNLFENFKHMTVSEFNEEYRVNYQGEMEIEKFTDYIESEDVDYFYASYCADDVVAECVMLYKEIGRKIDDLICVDGLYLALFN